MKYMYGVFGTSINTGGNRARYTSSVRTAIRSIAEIENAQIYRLPLTTFQETSWDNPTFRRVAERYRPTPQQYRAAGITAA